jgi:hypothetical protein
MKNLKLELFNFKKSLDFEQSEVSYIIEGHYNYLNDHSEKSVILSLNEKLKPFMYDKSIKRFVEGLNTDLMQYELVYELKNLYKVLDSKNGGELYRQPINVLIQTINLENDSDRMDRILNELAIYDWVPEIKLFVSNLTKSPEKRTNLLSGGKSDSVYTIVESVEGGHIAFIKDNWFFLSDGSIEKTLLENHVKDTNRFNTLRTLQTALQYCDVNESRIDFRLSEYLTVGIGVDKKDFFINEDKLNEETTLESIFSSPIVPIINKNFYPLILEVSKNLDSFVEFDVVKRITNLINPTLEIFAFNYKNNLYTYRCDERYGYTFYKFESAQELINDIKNELHYDISFFYENKLSKEVVKMRKLEDKEREITLKLEDVKFNINKLNSSIKLMGETPVLKEALNNLKKREGNLQLEIDSIKELKYNEKIRL